jgi:hypothetical protein
MSAVVSPTAVGNTPVNLPTENKSSNANSGDSFDVDGY